MISLRHVDGAESDGTNKRHTPLSGESHESRGGRLSIHTPAHRCTALDNASNA
jgi:hypothetical protein